MGNIIPRLLQNCITGQEGKITQRRDPKAEIQLCAPPTPTYIQPWKGEGARRDCIRIETPLGAGIDIEPLEGEGGKEGEGINYYWKGGGVEGGHKLLAPSPGREGEADYLMFFKGGIIGHAGMWNLHTLQQRWHPHHRHWFL